MALSKPYCFITDIGSTTTKGILIDVNNQKLLGISHADTTVEEPINDVNIGVYNAALELQQQCSVPILQPSASPESISFDSEISYLSTSSAGGGLQILVIGLTLFDSASSAKRAAYGAGGVILDVFAIDDKRKTVEQMQAMRNLRPDMILVCGGTDGGALSTVLRMAEILRIAKPLPKYSTSTKIPTIYAGNKDAVNMIKSMITRDFDLHILPNLRPSLQEEKLKPTQEKIQGLFMENVMERAPGYYKIKNLVSEAILPTPAGLLRSMQNLGLEDKNLIAFDIGGATTDVFTRINNHFQRTVSANLGMSYSALNVLKESGVESLMSMLPPDINEDQLRNYIGNKTIFPTVDPVGSVEYKIEHALAKAAITLAFAQHQQMHYNTQKLGYLDTLKQEGRDKYEEKFHYIENERRYSFYPSDIDILIGAGGVFAHARNTGQCIDMLISGFQPQGITQLMIDKHFISPHLGVLSQSDEELSRKLLESDCLEPLALYIRPNFPLKTGMKVLQIKLDGSQIKDVFSDDFILLTAEPKQRLNLKPGKKCLISGSSEAREIESALPIIIDTRMNPSIYSPKVARALNMYPDTPGAASFRNINVPLKGKYSRLIDLPYKGSIQVNEGSVVQPQDIVGINQYDPARLFVINAIPTNHQISEGLIREAMQVRVGEKITYDQILTNPIPEAEIKHPFRSPVRAKVEHIEYAVGIIVASEIQDYDLKPHKINLSDKLAVKPRQVSKYLLHHVGDFVYEEESLARKIDRNRGLMSVKSPTTGKIIGYDTNTGVITIQYPDKAYEYNALVHGQVSSVEEGKSAEIVFEATRLEASIGWGPKVYGILRWIDKPDAMEINSEDILVLDAAVSDEQFIGILETKPKAIICASLNERMLYQYLSMEQGVINTGFENLDTSLILMQGFGKLNYSTEQKEFLLNASGKGCYLDPHTRIRAGVVRAGIYVQ
ncbi:MAG: glutamate mutase L [Candidatus Cloacimonetes bacterium]|nr:glutamate mutase L [Candidatus Cloacimonadota bacterium]